MHGRYLFAIARKWQVEPGKVGKLTGYARENVWYDI